MSEKKMAHVAACTCAYACLEDACICSHELAHARTCVRAHMHASTHGRGCSANGRCQTHLAAFVIMPLCHLTYMPLTHA